MTLTERQRGLLASNLSDDLCAWTLGRTNAWVQAQRAAMAEAAAKPVAPVAAPVTIQPQVIPAGAILAVTAPVVASAPARGAYAPKAASRHVTRRQDMAEAYERPAVMPPHPADAAAERHERDFVREKRGAGVSWQNIGRMLGRPSADLQRKWGG